MTLHDEPTVSDGERGQMLLVISEHHSGNVTEGTLIANDLIASGYRKAPVVSVEDVARVIDPAIYPDINRLTGDGWAASVRAATAVMALLDPKEGK